MSDYPKGSWSWDWRPPRRDAVLYMTSPHPPWPDFRANNVMCLSTDGEMTRWEVKNGELVKHE